MDLNQYLQVTIAHYSSYHDHKERMAYLVTVLYLTAATALILRGERIWTNGAAPWLLVVLMVVAGLAAFAFVIWQLRNREYAADIVEACTLVAARSLAAQPQGADLTPESFRNLEFPAVVSRELRRICSNRGAFYGPRKAEWVTYGVMLVWAVAVVLSVSWCLQTPSAR